MNKHSCCTVFLSTRTPQEALKCLYTHPKGCAAGLSVKTASHIGLQVRFFGLHGMKAPPKPGLSMGRAYSQNPSELRKEVVGTQRPNIQSSICRGYPQVSAGGI